MKQLAIDFANYLSSKGDQGEIGDKWWNNKIETEQAWEQFLSETKSNNYISDYLH